MEDNTINLDLFDDVSDLPLLENTSKDKKIVSEDTEKDNIIDVDDDTIEDDNVNNDSNDNFNDDSDDNENYTEEEKELLEKVESLKTIGALFLPDNYEVESLEKAVQDSEQLRNNAAINSVFESIPDKNIPGIGNARELFKYLVGTGADSLESFVKVNDTSFLEKYDLDNTEHQKEILKTYYKRKDFSDTKIDRLISKHEDDLELDIEAKDAFDELQILDKKEKDNILKESKERKLKEEQLKEDRFNELAYTLQKENEFAGYKIPENAKEGALRNLYREVKLADGTKMSEFDYRLKNVVLQDPKLTLAVSDILNRIVKDTKTGEYKLDLSHISKIEETKATKKVKDAIDKLSSTQSKFKDSANSKRNKVDNWDSVIFN